ncbi:alpha/beta hydrolase [Brevibacterium sp. RIT 803]|uniref:alpha/beta hydrolase n=1 Tax=Brevibacterium sp. RIT 803 TaxID=2810210 RepID=UPI00194DEA15|nr:alpha/beta hydrolase [Brevibacterium sp. RIT 803]MBM6589350.1 alpha/beta hydrolase fold domain-containing protein [Brevibacterium sp. RIT 803]
MKQDERFAALGDAGADLGSKRAAFRCEYGTESDQFIEVYGDPGTASATVILVHGGYFRQRTDLAHARPMAVALAETGVLCVLIEYRRAGGQPDCLDDVTAAIAFASGSLSDWNVNARAQNHLVVTGHSAGGCLVLAWASHLGEDGPKVRLRPLAPITDLFREVEDGLGDGAVLDYMGGRPEKDPVPYLREDPRSRVLLIPSRVDLRILHGDRDQTVDIGFSRTFPARLTIAEGADHADLVDPESPYFPLTVDTLLR